MVQRRTTVWVDASGKTVAALLTTAAGAGAVQDALAAVSNAAVQAYWEGDLNVTETPAPVAALYQQVSDAALLLFETGAGSIVKIRVPAPHADIFMADGETVDPAAIGDLITAVLADVQTQDGTSVTSYVGGTRQ